ncbi:MAG: LapA family protein [Pedobacter sp.]
MSGKTITIIILTILLTIFLMVNNDAVEFNFIIGKPVEVSKLIVIGICILIGFILGFIAGRPRKTYSSYNDEVERSQAMEQRSTLSDEDRDYIS